jgi:hypothetical protein
MTARVPTPSFTVDAEGFLFAADGINNVKRWDGYVAAFADAGVPAPSTAVVVGGSSTGAIVGDRLAYQRWLDVAGRVSNCCPISNRYEAGATAKTISGATNATPIVITATSHGYSNGDTVKITGVGGNYSANGTRKVAGVTTHTFQIYEIDGTTPVAGVAAYTAGGEAQKGVGQLDYSSVDAPSDARVTTRQILRNKDGNTTVFYIDVSSTDLSATTFSSTTLDSALGEAVVLTDSEGNDLNLEANGEPPNWKRYIAQHYSRLWLAGSVEYKEGAVVLTNGSATVTGLGTGWTSAMVGWTFFPRGASNTVVYTVSAVNTSTQTITLSAVYAGTTVPFAYYGLTPGTEETRTLYWSGTGLPDSFDLNRALTIPADKDIGGVTGLMPFGSQLYVLFENRMYRIVYQVDPDDGQPARAAFRGCVGHNCWVAVDDAVYLMDRKGFWQFYGNASEPIGKEIQPLFHATEGFRINWTRTEHFHACHDPLRETIKWFVCLAGSRYPFHAVCYQYRLQRWWIEEYSVPILSSTLGRIDGTPQVFLGSEHRRILAPGGTMDGSRAENGTVGGTVTSAGLCTLTDSTASFHTTKLVGVPVRIIAETGAQQVRIILSATATVLTVDQPWNVTPDSTSRYQIGGIKCTLRTGWYRDVQTGKDEKRGFELAMRPADDGYLCVRRYRDRSETPENAEVTGITDGVSYTNGSPEYEVDVTKTSGFFAKHEDGFRDFRTDGPRHLQMELEFVPSSDPIEISELNILGSGGKQR